MKNILNILFLGDIVGRPGRKGVDKYIKETRENYDFIIANVENASHGFGLTEKNYYEISGVGINAMTSGNHIWDRKEILTYIEKAEKLIRPLNYPESSPGKGSRIFKIDDKTSVGIINILGAVFMAPLLSPWNILIKEIEKMKKETNIIIIDFHAEATAEKLSGGYIAESMGVSAFIGTHTHVQTADETLLGGKTAYITDVGFCGSYNSIIGMEKEDSIQRFLKMLPSRLEVGPLGLVQINGVEFKIDAQTGTAQSITRISEVIKLDSEVN
jgi:hypothetical protein